MSKESDIYITLSKYISLKYPGVIFRFDGGGVRLTMGQAVFNKKINPHPGYPDFFLAQPFFMKLKGMGRQVIYIGLFIEIKKVTPYLKDGHTLKADPHLKEQEAMLNRLGSLGFKVCFATGIDECINIIDSYLQDSCVIT